MQSDKTYILQQEIYQLPSFFEHIESGSTLDMDPVW